MGRGDDWRGLGEAFARAGDLQRAEKCASHAVDEVLASPEAGHIMLSTAKPQRLIRIANTLAGIGCGEGAEETARAAVTSCLPGEVAYVLNDLAKLAVLLCGLQRTEGAAFLTGYIVQSAQDEAARGGRTATLAALALAAARRGQRQASLDLSDRAYVEWNASGDSLLSAQVLGTLSRARALNDPATRLEHERELADQLSGLSKAKALALIAGSSAIFLEEGSSWVLAPSIA